MFRITTRATDDEVVLTLEGCLSAALVEEVEACWRRALETLDGRQLRVDLRALWRVDAEGRDLLATMHHVGAQFVASGCVMPELVREISESAGVSAEARNQQADLAAEARNKQADLSAEARNQKADLSAEARSAKAERS
jgi:anti-anti-sigma regulatory factor